MSIRSGSIFHDPAISSSICIADSVIRKSMLSHCIFFLLLFFLLSHFIFWSRLFLVLWSWLSSLQFAWETVKSFLKIDRKYQMNVSDLWRAAWAPAVWPLQAESSAPCHCGWEWSELLLQADFSNPSSKGIFSVKHWAAATVELVEFCYWRVTRTV